MSADPDLSRCAITGAGGLIARAIPWGVKLSRADLDVEDFAAAARRLDEVRPTSILHLAALDLRRSERDPVGALRVNALATQRLAAYASRAGIPFAYVSSGAVFFGPPGSRFDETAIPDPRTIYGLTKHLGELLALAAHPDALLIRTGWIFGGRGAHHRNVVDIVIERAAAGAPIDASEDHEGSPTSVADFVRAVGALLARGESGIVHVVNDGAGTAAAIAETIVRTMGSASRINHVSFTELAAASGAPGQRSPCEVLVSRRVRLRPWPQALEAYVRATVAAGPERA
jgi:dTDP-4-dehydrorhamnose reductase